MSLTYKQVLDLSHEVAKALWRSGVTPGDKVAILSANHPRSFACVFGISRAGAVWCSINLRSAASENAELLDLFDCVNLFYQPAFDELVADIAPKLPNLTTLVRLSESNGVAVGFDAWLAHEAHDDHVAR